VLVTPDQPLPSASWLDREKERIVQIAAAGSALYALTSDGRVFVRFEVSNGSWWSECIAPPLRGTP
jgi:hypothetical protein